jgi:hypothetical protein
VYQGVATCNDATTREFLAQPTGDQPNFAFAEFYEVRRASKKHATLSLVKLLPIRITSIRRYSVAVYCFTQRIQAGKRDQAKSIFEEVSGPRRQEYEASRRRLGIRREKVWFQSSPNGDMAVVYWEGEDPRAALREFASSEDPFDEWLKERGREVYHFEPAQTLEEDEEVFEAEVR